MRLRSHALAVLGSGLLLGGSAEAQTTWARSYGGSLVDRANAVDVIPSGGYVVAGSFGSGFGDLWVLRLDAQGAVVWQKTFGGSQPDEAFAVKSTSDGGFVVAGVTHSFGAGGGDGWVLKLDAQGNVVGQRAFGGSGLDEVRSLAVVADGYVFAGTTQSFGSGAGDAWAFKLDGQLQLVWSRTYGDAAAGTGTSVLAAAGPGVVLGGTGFTLGVGFYSAILKLDDAGTPTWSAFWGTTAGSVAATIAGGGFLAVSSINPQTLAVKVDDLGQHVWSRAYTNVGVLSDVAVLADGGFVLTGGAVLLRIDSAGTPLWSRTYGGPGAEVMRSLVPTADGGYVVAGETTSFGGGSVDAWVIKVNSQGFLEGACPYAATVSGGSSPGSGLITRTWAVTTAAAAPANSSTTPAIPSALALAQCQSLVPASLAVDATASGGSNLNRLFEPGEACVIEPGWNNRNAFPVANLTGTIVAFIGPAGAVYSVDDNAANYGSIASGATTDCDGATSDCYVLRVSNPSPRPVTHWDGDFIEDLSTGERRIWRLHVGGSFTDVPLTSGFYRFVETLLHRGVTSGCGGGAYCPASSTTREQMSVFVLVAREGASYAPPACGTPVFADVPASSPFCRWIEELARRGVTSGCGGGNFCPTAAVSREQMAVFVLRTLDPTLNPPACTTPVFNDVPASSPFCRWIEELARRGVVTGCGGGNYCPSAPVTREQMAVFLTGTFGLTLYGP